MVFFLTVMEASALQENYFSISTSIRVAFQPHLIARFAPKEPPLPPRTAKNQPDDATTHLGNDINDVPFSDTPDP